MASVWVQRFGVTGRRVVIRRSSPYHQIPFLSFTVSSRFVSTETEVDTTPPPPLSVPHLSTSDCYFLVPPMPNPILRQNNPGDFESVWHELGSDELYYSMVESELLRVGNKSKNRLKVDLGNATDHACIGSSRGWLAYVNLQNFASYLINPFIASPPIVPLPPIESFPSVSMSIRRRITNPNPNPNPSSSTDDNKYEYQSEYLMMGEAEAFSPKAMLDYLSKPKLAPKFAVSSESECLMVAMNGRLAFCRFGDTAWTPLISVLDGNISTRDHVHHYRSLVYSHFHRRFYALSDTGLQAWDLTNPCSPKRTFFKHFRPYNLPMSLGIDCNGARLQLLAVDDTGEIWMAIQHFKKEEDEEEEEQGRRQGAAAAADDHPNPFKPIINLYDESDRSHCMVAGVDVIKIDVGEDTSKTPKMAERVTCFGDRLLFLDHNQAAVVSARDFPSLEPNRMYNIENYTCDLEEVMNTIVDEDILGYETLNRGIEASWSWVIPHAVG